MTLIPGKQIEVSPNGVATANLNDDVLSADAAGRAKMASGFFDFATVGTKVAAAAIALSKLEELVIQADGGQAFTADQSLGNFKITNLATPTATGDAATKGYVDALVTTGVSDKKESCRVGTDAALPANTRTGNVLTASANGSLNATGIDSVVTLVVGDRVLVQDEAATENNGIYDITDLGSGGTPWILTRSADADTSAEVTAGMFTFVTEGTANSDRLFSLATNDPITLNTTGLAFTIMGGIADLVAGLGLTKTSNTLDVGAGAGIQVNADSVEVLYGSVGDLTAVNAGDAASAGALNTAARSDHQHAVATATAVGLGTANAEGVSTSLSRADHVHARDVQQQESVTTQSIINTDTAITDTLNATPISNASVRLYLNGLLQRQGAGFDYTISGTTITWLAATGTAVNMATSDELIATYSSAT